MELIKMPVMGRQACEQLLTQEFVCRVAFKGDRYPFIAPLLYVFDGKHLFFLATKYGKKIECFRENPLVVVEVEQKSNNLSRFSFVTITGRVVEVVDPEEQRTVRRTFIRLLQQRSLSKNVLAALGHDPHQPFEVLEQEEKTLVWKLVEVAEIRGLANS